MPGVSPPNQEFFLRQLIELKRQFDGLVTNQQMIFSNASDEVIVATGLLPGTNPPNYGLAGYSGATNTPVFALYETTIPDGSGRRQTVVGIARDDGSLALMCADLGTVLNHPHQQALAWFDRGGNVVFADDTVSGVGIARPHLSMCGGLVNLNPSTWPATTATSATAISGGVSEYQQPKVQWAFYISASANTNGTFTLEYNGATVATQTIVGGTSGNTLYWSSTAAVPSGLTFGSLYNVTLLAQVTSGTGSVGAQCLLLQGAGS